MGKKFMEWSNLADVFRRFPAPAGQTSPFDFAQGRLSKILIRLLRKYDNCVLFRISVSNFTCYYFCVFEKSTTLV